MSIQDYSIVDSCCVAVEKFMKMNLPGNAYLEDILDEKNRLDTIANEFDIVFSIGLVEHFRENDIEKIIQSHFSL